MLFFVVLHHLKGIVELQSIAAVVGSSLVVLFAVNRSCSLMCDARWVSITVVNSALPQLFYIISVLMVKQAELQTGTNQYDTSECHLNMKCRIENEIYALDNTQIIYKWMLAFF